MELLRSADRDETVSWRAASVIMGLISLYSVSLRLFNYLESKPDLFVWEFEALILYLPTVLLLGVGAYNRRRSSVTAHDNAGGGGA